MIAAQERYNNVESQLERIVQIEPPNSLGQYHQLQLQHSEYTLQFLSEVQVAYDISVRKFQRDAAYQQAGNFNRQVNQIQDRMTAELQSLGYEPE